MEEAELTETPDAEVTEEREEWTMERAWWDTTRDREEKPQLRVNNQVSTLGFQRG